MTTAGRLAPNRPEAYGPRDEAYGSDDLGSIGRIFERLRPDEGWLSLPLVMLLAGTIGWSIADARWILGRDELTSFLIWVALAATVWGYVGARLDLPPWIAHGLGCVIGAFVVIELIGASLPDATPGLVGWFHATANSVVQAYLDLTWRHQTSTLQVGHFCLVLGILVWGTAQAASYDIFGYHRAVNGVLLLAVVLVASQALTTRDQFTGLVVFSAAALVVLLLAHAADERSSWLRHRIWRGRDFKAPHLQGGLAFATLAVVGSLILTTVASSSPLAAPLKDVGSNVENALSWMSGYLPNGGISRFQPSADFGSTADVKPSFNESQHQVFTISVPSGALSFHWRLVAYDTFQTVGWTLGSNPSQDRVNAGDELDAGTLDFVGPNAPGRTQVTLTVHIQDKTIQHLIVSNEPYTTSADVQRTLVGGGPSSANLAWLSTDSTDYTVSAYVPNLDPSGNGLTEWLLQHAGTDYPAGLQARYTQGASQIGSKGKALLLEIATWAHSTGNPFDNEFDVAKAIQAYLQSDRFAYSTDITAQMPRCTGLSTVDCFALIREGFCEQYATTMTMLMRMDGYPARYVLGYLPGAIAQNTLVQQVTSQQKHAWVEVFFPTYGWIPFDPTGGGVGQPTQLQPGAAVSATPTPVATPTPSGATRTVAPRPSPKPSGGGATGNDNGPTLLLVTTALSSALVLALFVVWRRRPRRPDGPDEVYRKVVRLASRLGYRPRPTQTVYEYAGMLADIVPQARDSLGIVATARVEVAYGKQQLSAERLVFLATAHRILRQALLRLALRMPGRRTKGKGPGGSARARDASGPSGS